MSTSNFIRRMNFFQILWALVGIYRKSFVPLTIMTMINATVSFLLFGLVISYSSDNITGLIGIIVFLFAPVFYAGPILVAMSNTVLGNKVKVLESYRGGLSIGLLFKTLLAALPACLISFASIFFVNGGGEGALVFFYLIFFLLMPVWIFFPISLLLEKKGFWRSIPRSLKFFFLNFGRNILIMIACCVFAIPFVILGTLVDPIFGNLFGLFSSNPIDVGIFYAVPFVTMFAISLYVMAYYETRARRENYTVDVLSQELGFAPLDEMMSM